MMTLEQQVVSLDLARKLKELGVKQESAFYWEKQYSGSREGKYDLACYKYWGCYECDTEDGRCSCDLREIAKTTKYDGQSGFDETDAYAAFTVAELGEMLPQAFKVWRDGSIENPMWKCSQFTDDYNSANINGLWSHGNTMAEALAKMLIYLIEKGIVKP